MVVSNSLTKNSSVLVCIALCTILLFYKSLSYDFTYDDFFQIAEAKEPYVLKNHLKRFHNIFFNASPPGDLYRPITLATYRLDFLIAGLNPAWFHFVNLLLHIACVIIVFFLARALGIGNNLSAVGALLFAVHPIHVEAVSNISGRAELLSAAFGMTSALALRRALSSSTTKSAAFLFLSGLLFLLSTFSKESGLAFLLVILPYALIHNHKIKWGKLCRITIIFLLIAGLNLLVRKYVLDSQFLAQGGTDDGSYWENPIYFLPFYSRIVPGIRILGEYIWFLIYPLNLSADYSKLPFIFLRETYSSPGIMFALLFLGYLFLLYRYRTKCWVIFGAWFLLTFSLTCNLLVPIGTIMGDRLAYTPSVGFILFSVCLCDHLLSHSNFRLRMFVPTIFIVLFAFQTFKREEVWKNDQVLYYSTLSDSQRSPKALYNYACYLLYRQNNESAAEPYFREVLHIYPIHYFSLSALYKMFLKKNDLARAAYFAKQIVEAYPEESGPKLYLEKYEESKKTQTEAAKP